MTKSFFGINHIYKVILLLLCAWVFLGVNNTYAQIPTPSQLPTNVTSVLNQVPNIGNLSTNDVSKLIQNPQISGPLTHSLTQALGSAGGVGNAVSQLTQFAQIASNPASILSNPQALGQVISDALKQIAPQLSQEISEALGGALSQALGGALASPAVQQQAQQQQQQQQQEEEKKEKQCSFDGCKGCCACANCPVKINQNHVAIRTHETTEFQALRSWLVTTWWIELVAPALGAMTSQFNATMMLQVEAIGAFFDAKHQLETQRLFQQLTAKAHKDYHPSQELCAIGTNVRSLANSERKVDLVQSALANRMMQRQLSQGDALSTEGRDSDRRSRLRAVIDTYCRPTDNGGDLNILCKATKKDRMNMDVDYTSAMENKLSLKLNFGKGKEGDVTEDEENIMALSSNLFAHEVIEKIPAATMGESPTKIYDKAYYYLRYRAVAAKRGVAQNSFASIAALKAEGDESENATGPFLKAILAEAGVNPNEIEKRLGQNPSYFAQMEIITKDIYQNPKFYSDLYDKPVNVERKSAALQAIELIQDRDIYQSLLRSEAVLATLVETLLKQEHERVTSQLQPLSSQQ